MSNKIKRFILCLLSALTLATAGTIHAEGDEFDLMTNASADEAEVGEEAAESKSKRTESVEEVELTAAEAERLLHKIGSVDGFDIYSKSENYKDEIRAAHGGNPKDEENYDKNAGMTAEDKAAEADTALLKKIGVLVAVDPEAGRAIASFDGGKKCDEGKIFLSDAGRYLLTVDEELTRVLKIREIVSTIDDPYLFMTKDGKTLELMNKDYTNTEAVYIYSSESDGKRIYSILSGNDEKGFAWLSTDIKQVYGTFRYAAENEGFRLLVDDRTAIIGLENKKTGYIWWSSPIGATRDEIATPLLINELRSSSVLRYGIPAKRSSNNYLYSDTADCTVKVSDIKDGIRVIYDYKKAGVSYPVEYTVENDHLKASLKVSEIKETNPSNIATEVTLLGSFGAASTEEEGYFVIPDGSGALVRFNNGKAVNNAYSQRVYGSDVTAVPATKGAVNEQIYLPVYGIVKEDNAMLVVASKGDSNAFLNASVSLQSNSSYNLCNFTFVLRSMDTFYMSGSIKEELTVFENGGIKSDDIELLYYPIAKENADYVDIAAEYRKYLLEEKGVTVKAKADSAPMYVDLYGGVEKVKPILGFPVKMKTSITGYSETESILTQLRDRGVDDMVVSYLNWTSDGIKNQVDTDAEPSGTLGGKSDFNKLKAFIKENEIGFYPSSDNRDFYSGNGYFTFTSTAVRVSGAYSRIVSYDRAYGIQDGFKDNMSLLSPSLYSKVFAKAADSYVGRGLRGISIGSLTSSLYGDYGKKNISRYDAMKLLSESYESIAGKLSGGILADTANAYALPYVSHITCVPMTSSRYDMFNEDIPFYQLVMHGIIPYSTTAVNGDADSEMLLLMAAATGSCLSYDMLYEETSILKDTEFDIYFYANYANWIDTAAKEYRLAAPVLSKVSDCTITDYQVENGTLITTTYSDGTIIKVNLENKTINDNGTEYNLTEYAEKGGFTF